VFCFSRASQSLSFSGFPYSWILGSHRNDRGDGEIYENLKFFIHPNHQHTHKGHDDDFDVFDLAISVVDRPIQLSLKILPICLPDSSTDFYLKEVTVAGW
jgi:hypothetical protein